MIQREAISTVSRSLGNTRIPASSTPHRACLACCRIVNLGRLGLIDSERQTGCGSRAGAVNWLFDVYRKSVILVPGLDH